MPCDKGLGAKFAASSVLLDKRAAFQNKCRKEAFRADKFTFGEENLGRANFGKPIEGSSKFNSSEIDFTASKIIKPATPTITKANKMVLRPMTKFQEELLKPQ